jgi:hypothetical protein
MSKQASSARAHERAAPAVAAPAAEAPLAAPPAAESPDPYTVGAIRFMHLAEAEFARLLNYYQVAWEYEPREFALEWDGDRVVRQFRPDFYLPEYDLYIELTVMKQSLVRRKNRKLRLLRALYPDVQIKLLYRRDFHRLLQGFGLPPSSIEPGAARPHAA